MAPTSQDNASLEHLEFRLRGRDLVVEIGDLLLESPLCLIALFREGVKSQGKPIIQTCERGDLLARYRLYACILWRRWHLFLKSRTRS